MKLKSLWRLLNLRKQDLLNIYLFATFSGLLQLTVPIGIQAIVGFAMGVSMSVSLYILIVAVVLAVMVVGILQLNQMKIVEKIQQTLFVEIAEKYALTQPKLESVPAAQISNMHNKVNSFFEVVTLQKGISKMLLDVPIASIQILFGILLLCIYHPLFILLAFILLFIIYYLWKATGSRALESNYKESKYKYALAGWFQEVAQHLFTFKMSGNAFTLFKTDNFAELYLKARTTHFKILLFQFSTLIAFKGIITLAMLLIGVLLLVSQKISVGEFIASEIVILTIIAAIEKLMSNLEVVYDLVTASEKITEFLTQKTETTKDGIALQKIERIKIEKLENEHFSGINLMPGRIHIFTGAQGSGKSKLAEALAFVQNSSEYKILINEVLCEAYNQQDLRDRMGACFQSESVFDGTLSENIFQHTEQSEPNQLLALLQNTGNVDLLNQFKISESVLQNPGLNDEVQQRILILRAISQASDLLVLDNPWILKNLDKNKQLIDYLQALSKNKIVCIFSNFPVPLEQDTEIYEVKSEGIIHKNKAS